MLKAKLELEKYLEKQFLSKIAINTNKTKSFCEYIERKYGIPYVTALDYVTMRTPLFEANEFMLFCLLDTCVFITTSANDLKGDKLSEYFTDKEIQTYSNSQYKVDKIKFPLRFKAIKISDTQWSSSIDFKTLMKLRAAQLITYNENTQRTMERIVQGDKEYFKIKVDKKTVNEIEKSYLDGTYIPTPFTFNIPEDSASDFYYDESKSELVIKKLDRFDIVDGYHRYVAACKVCDNDSKFNFTMELRILNVPEYKAQHFIFQEDQKTKMKKADSNTYNQASLANQIVERLNTDPASNLRGHIGRNKGLINFSDLAVLIEFYYLEKNKSASLITVKNELITSFNILTEYDITFLTEKYSYKKLCVIMHCFKYFVDIDKTKMCNVIMEMLNNIKQLDSKLFYSKKPRIAVTNEIQKLLEEVLENVL